VLLILHQIWCNNALLGQYPPAVLRYQSLLILAGRGLPITGCHRRSWLLAIGALQYPVTSITPVMRSHTHQRCVANKGMEVGPHG
jgi:hypothetical protein